MEDIPILINDNFYSQRTPHSKIVISNLKKEKIGATDKGPESFYEIKEKFEEMERRPEKYFNYMIENGGVVITKIYSGNDTHIKIPSYIDGYPVKELGGEVLENDAVVEQIILPSSINKLHDSCFDNAKYLRSINLPSIVKTIPIYCFDNCKELFDIDLSHVKEIGYCAFKNTALTSINLIDIEIINQKAFENCQNLRKIYLSNKISSLPYQCFRGCVSLEDIYIPDNVIMLGVSTFEDCSKLSTIRFPETLRMICDFCFAYCKSLKEFIAPRDLEEIQRKAFENSGLKKIILNKKLQKIEEGAFDKCHKLNIIELYSNTDVLITKSFDFDKMDKIKIINEKNKEEARER